MHKAFLRCWKVRSSCPAASRPGLVVTLLLCVVGGANVLFHVNDLASQHASAGWPTVTGRVAGDAESAWYEYTVAGVRYTRWQAGITPGFVVLHRIPPAGSSVTVSYCPSAPDVSTIYPGISADMLVVPVALGALVCIPGVRGLARNTKLWLVLRSRRADRAHSRN